MKKEYLILIAIILILGAYLFLHKENKDNYTLPVIQKIEANQISSITLNSDQNNLEFRKKGDNWVISKEEYLASSSSIQNMIDTLSTFKLTALVAEKGDKRRYELDDEQGIQVTAYKGDQSIFEFSIGKTAPTFNHTFVMLKDDNNIYHANGSFRSNFDKELDDFRDKKVLEFKKESIQQFSVEKDGLSKTLIAENKTDKSLAEKKQDRDAEKMADGNSEIEWISTDESIVDKTVVNDFLSVISLLECEKYLYEIQKDQVAAQKKLLAAISLENPSKMELNLYKNEADKLIGTSSMNDYAFELSAYTGQEIIEKIDTLLGIKKEASEKKD